jgi:hypothetical protein
LIYNVELTGKPKDKSIVKILLIPLILLMLPVELLAQERLEMEGTSIIGNKELPKVLYIVPWKPADKIDLSTPAYSSVLDDALQPLEPDSFRRQVKYYRELYPEP